jgi:hypothetical protein
MTRAAGDPGIAIVQCGRVGQVEPTAGAIIVGCLTCAVPVWFHTDDESLGKVATYCPTCVPKKPLMFSPGQMQVLRDRGLDDDGIARMLAITRLTAGDVTRIPELADEIAADPGAARRLDEATAAAAADLREVHG